jgi:hypothetical protein
MKTLRRDIVIGLDLGQTHDPSAFAICERVEYEGERNAVTFAYDRVVVKNLRHVERLALGLPYPDVVARVKRLLGSKSMLEADAVYLVVDQTGVGRPVIDMMYEADLACKILPVTITSGANEAESGDGYRVPKRDLITGLLLLLQNGALNLSVGMRDGAALTKELSAMRVSVTAGGREKYGAKSGEHDDLVLATALAGWGLKKLERRVTWGLRPESIGVY